MSERPLLIVEERRAGSRIGSPGREPAAAEAGDKDFPASTADEFADELCLGSRSMLCNLCDAGASEGTVAVVGRGRRLEAICVREKIPR